MSDGNDVLLNACVSAKCYAPDIITSTHSALFHQTKYDGYALEQLRDAKLANDRIAEALDAAIAALEPAGAERRAA